MQVDELVAGTGAADRSAIQPVLFCGYNKNRRSYESLTDNNWDATIGKFWRAFAPFGTTDQPTIGAGSDTNELQ